MERPILMTAESVKAILDGRKTMTRRVIKPQPVLAEEYGLWLWQRNNYWNKTFAQADWAVDKPAPEYVLEFCPYGQVGDRLWVRETYKLHTYAGSPAYTQIMLEYKAGGLTGWLRLNDVEPKPPFKFQKWQPSIFMPRWASRLTLEITGVRVERLQEITLLDVYSEGIYIPPAYEDITHPVAKYNAIRLCFQDLWDSLNAKRGYGWDFNPWVWVIKFDNIGVRVK